MCSSSASRSARALAALAAAGTAPVVFTTCRLT